MILGIPIVALIFLYDYLGSELFWLCGKLFLLALCITLIPSISAALTNNIIFIAFIDILSFSLCLTGAFWLFKLPFSLHGITYGVGLIAVTEIGGLLNMSNINYTLVSLKQNSDAHLFHRSIEKIKKIVLYGRLVYVSIPLAILAGAITAMVRLSSVSETLRFTVIITLSVVAFGLLVITIVEFVGMSHPFTYMSFSEEIDLKRKLDQAYTITEIRKIYLLDSIHNIILVVSITMVVLHLSHVTFLDSIEMLIPLFIILLFLFNQLPYVIGQSLMRRKLLSKIQGLKKAELLEIMDKYMPLFPKGRYITTLMMSGTAGYYIFKSLEKVLLDILGKVLGITP